MSDLTKKEEIKMLEEKIRELQRDVPAHEDPHLPRAKLPHKVRARRMRRPRVFRRNPRVILPGNYALTTIPGSLYSTLLLVLGALGKLDLQEALFAKFLKHKTPGGARKLLDKIGVARQQLDRHIRLDRAFKSYCAIRTSRLTGKAARGDKESLKILSNPKMCSSRRWVGDIDEAVNILRGAREEEGLRTLKNVGILRRARSGKNVGLMFNTSWRGNNQFCFLYPRKFHSAFRQARALAGE